MNTTTYNIFHTDRSDSEINSHINLDYADMISHWYDYFIEMATWDEDTEYALNEEVYVNPETNMFELEYPDLEKDMQQKLLISYIFSNFEELFNKIINNYYGDFIITRVNDDFSEIVEKKEIKAFLFLKLQQEYDQCGNSSRFNK